MEEAKQAAVEQSASNEYSHHRVPMSARKGWMSLLTISLGYVFNEERGNAK